VNEQPQTLNAVLLASIPDLEGWTIEWVSPLAADEYQELRDRAFLDALGLGAHAEALSEFWPSRGPRWDALARLRSGSAAGALLVEAKAHATEIETGSCGAIAESSIEKIRESLTATAAHFGAPGFLENWLQRRYQQANRLAHLYFLEKVGVPAWLANVYFLDDRSHLPTTRDDWGPALAKVKDDMGVDPADLHRCTDVFIDAIND
jgi:hypothetical protein